MQSQNRFFDEVAKMMTSAAGAAKGFREDVEALVRAQMERLLASMDLVSREEFDAVQAMAQKARAEVDTLSARLAALEAALDDGVEAAPNRPRNGPASTKRR